MKDNNSYLIYEMCTASLNFTNIYEHSHEYLWRFIEGVNYRRGWNILGEFSG
jgi:hypothetical protein